MPGLFQALTSEPDPQERWLTFTYPVDFDVALFTPKHGKEMKYKTRKSIQIYYNLYFKQIKTKKKKSFHRNCGGRGASSSKAKRDDGELHCRVYGTVQLVEQVSRILSEHGCDELQVVPRRLLRVHWWHLHQLWDQWVALRSLSSGQGGRDQGSIWRLWTGRRGIARGRDRLMIHFILARFVKSYSRQIGNHSPSEFFFSFFISSFFFFRTVYLQFWRIGQETRWKFIF